MATEIKHHVLVTLGEEPEHGTPAQFLLGELEKELPGKGARKCVKVRITSTTDIKKLLLGKSVEVLYLPKERHDIHKERKDFPPDWALTIIDNGVLFSDGSGDSIYRREKESLEAKLTAVEKDRDNLRSYMMREGTMGFLEYELRKKLFVDKALSKLSPEEKEKIIREKIEEKKT